MAGSSGRLVDFRNFEAYECCYRVTALQHYTVRHAVNMEMAFHCLPCSNTSNHNAAFPTLIQSTNVLFLIKIWRALRLVVDAGLHSKGLTRQQALDLFDKYAWDDSDIPEKELTRYQSGPGQATAYMIGQLTINRLRRYATDKLGENFDLKDFHFQVIHYVCDGNECGERHML